jgi:hypothetical protein
MAEIHAKYDTKTKNLAVSCDGKAMADVHSLRIGRAYADGGYSDDKYDLDMATLTKDPEHKTTHITHLSASEKPDGTVEFVPVDAKSAKLQADIQKYLNRD